jgi:putative ABC transport system permease protein
MARMPEIDLTFRIVGVVADAQPLTPGEAPHPEIYWSNRQLGRGATFFLVRAAGDPAALAQPLKDALLEVDPDLSVGAAVPLAVNEARMLVRPRFEALVILVFALAALALSAVGVYAVVSYSVARRAREMGIRMALGAASGDVVAMVVRAAVGVALLGIGLGLVGALLTGRLAGGLVHGVSPTDPVSLGGAALILTAAATLAAWLPARRVTRADPLLAIRAE